MTKKFQIFFDVLPGLLLALVLMLLSLFLSNVFGHYIPKGKNPFSTILIAIILGMALRNTVKIPSLLDPGIKFGIKKLLRIGIVLMGIRLSVMDALKIGSTALLLVVVCITSAILITVFLAKKIKISQKLGALIAAGTSICGISAIVATAPVIEADEEEISYSIGIITIMGLTATIFYPYIIELLFHFNVLQAGFFIGTAVHDTSQVTAAAFAYDQIWAHPLMNGLSSADVAITTKLVRNTFMIAVVPILGLYFRRKEGKTGAGSKLKVRDVIPFFVFGYLIFGVLRTAGDFALGTQNQVWAGICNNTKDLATHIITTAIACIGLSTDIKKITKLGIKPFIAGTTAALVVAGISFSLISVFGGYLTP